MLLPAFSRQCWSSFACMNGQARLALLAPPRHEPKSVNVIVIGIIVNISKPAHNVDVI